MIYYNTDNKGEFTNNKRLAELKVKQGAWKEFGESEEEFVMQSDGSDYVPKSEYIEIKHPDVISLEERIADLEEALIEIMGMPVEESTEEPTDEQVEEQVSEPVEEQTKEPTDEQVNEPIEQPTEQSENTVEGE